MSSSPSPSKTDTADFKTKLDEAARQAQYRSPQNNGSQSENPTPGLVEKVAQYIPEPISSKVVCRDSPEKQQQEQQKNPSPPPHVPPKRPDHDEHIEEFIRDQHRSTGLVLEE